MTTPRSNIVKLRLTDLEKKDWQEAAGGARKLSEWVRAQCNAAITEILTAEHESPEVTVKYVPKPLVVEDAITRDTTPKQCPRWMHHRPGVYCGSCKQVVKK